MMFVAVMISYFILFSNFRFLYAELKTYYSGKRAASIFDLSENSNLLCLKKNVSIHLYISSPLAGDYRENLQRGWVQTSQGMQNGNLVISCHGSSILHMVFSLKTFLKNEMLFCIFRHHLWLPFSSLQISFVGFIFYCLLT